MPHKKFQPAVHPNAPLTYIEKKALKDDAKKRAKSITANHEVYKTHIERRVGPLFAWRDFMGSDDPKGE